MSERAVWLNLHSDPDYVKLAANGISWPYFDIREPRIRQRGYLDTVAAHAGIEGCGVYSVRGTNSWPETDDLSPEDFARWTHEQLLSIGWAGNPRVMFDIEGMADLVPFILGTLRAWRQLRPKRITDLTIEGHKGGLFRPSDVIAVVAQTRFTVPQCYNGAMNQTWDTWAMAMDLFAVGFPPAKVCPFYDAAHLPEWWGVPAGFAFTQGRLP